MPSSDRIVRDALRASGAHGPGLLAVAVLDPATRLLLPAALAGALDAAIGKEPQGRAVVPVIAVFALLALTTATEAAREILEKRSAARATLALRRRVLHQVLALGRAGQDAFGPGDVLSRLLGSSAGTAPAAQYLVGLAASLLTSLGGLVGLFLIDVRLGLFFLLGAPLMWWLGRWLMSRVGSATHTYQEIHGELAERFVDALRGARTIRAAGTAEQEAARVLAPLPRLRAAGLDFWQTQRKATWQAGLVTPLVQIGVLAVAGLGVLHGRITPGELLASQAYLGYALGLLKQTAMLAQLARCRGSAARIGELLDVPAPSAGTRPLPDGPGRLTLRGVRVARSGTPLLNGVDLDVPAGHSVAVIGASGAGKSTLTEIAGGLLAPDSGDVLLDGVPLRDIRPDELRRAVGYAFERPTLLGDTLGDALAYADHPPPPHRVASALRAGSADAFVTRLPDGLATPLHRLRLSGGELQRLGLARVAARQARLVVLDDATSSVDTATESEITAALDRVLFGTTRLIVAHRMSTAAGADLVAWLDRGTLRALAPHKALLKDPEYRAVFQLPDPRPAPADPGPAPDETLRLRLPGAEHPTMQLRLGW
ncbi:ABC transporter ATP-binding protein [Streptomyces sp. Rer75]|uniref:ABC transporter ATP-binding protein n=1 Tax=Streptomyces sp. Rer75 TaxID=2750011 RepID=UPI0015D08601|nr:ABC transporter ATP-binding protein [Streptomyces sp. Rer75]QLH23264.1 ABC transporter ATP-binding protein [Streptomyces sp. Rer75]